MSWRRLIIILSVIYFLFLLFCYLYTMLHINYRERVFTKKELSDGPLLLKEDQFPVLGNGKVVFGQVVLAPEGAFDQPLQDEEDDTASDDVTEQFYEDLLSKANELSSQTPDGLFYVTFVNTAFLKMTLNWLCNTHVFNTVHSRMLIISTQNTLCKRVQQEFRVACLSADLHGYSTAFDWGQKEYVRMLSLRTQILNSIVQESLKFVLVEMDSVWFRDPLEFFLNQTILDDADIVVPIKGYTEKGDSLAFDPMLVLPTNGSKDLFNELNERQLNDSSVYDQDVLNELCSTQFNGTVCRTFQWEDIADGKWFKMSEAERAEYRPLIVNNNFYVGVSNKESRQALNGLWFITRNGHCTKSKVKKALAKHNQTSEKDYRNIIN